MKHAETRFILFVVIVLTVLGSACSEGETQTSKSEGLLSESHESQVESTEIIGTPGPAGRIDGFDLHATYASASVLALGLDVRIHNDGQFLFETTGQPETREELYRVAGISIGRDDSKESRLSVPLFLEREDSTVTVRHRRATQIFEHRHDGLKHTVVIDQRPEGSGPLTVKFAAQGAHSVKSDRIFVNTGETRSGFTWTGLRVFDASGVEHMARFRSSSEGFAIEVEDTDATYPLHVDPLASSPSDTLVGGQDGGGFGSSVGGGDLTSTGFSDLVVGQAGYTNGQNQEGRVLIYPGSAASISSTAIWSWEPNVASVQAGSSLAVLDINDSGFLDLVVGAPAASPGGVSFAGQAHVFDGSQSGPATAPSTTLEGNLASGFFGFLVRKVGDLNCDGVDDLAISSAFYDSSNGKAWVWYGASGGINDPADLEITGSGGENFGSGLSFSNVDNDTVTVGQDTFPCDDLIVGSSSFDGATTNGGQVQVFSGSSTGVTTPATWSYEGTSAGFLGTSVAGGDFNGDGIGDIAVGESRRDGAAGVNSGGVVGFYGIQGSGLPSTPDYDFEHDRAGSFYGQAMAGHFDFNADGYDDIIVGMPSYSRGQTNEGAISIEFGSSTGLTGQEAVFFETNNNGAQLGFAVASVGDLNGDGFGDAAAGARTFESNGNSVGSAYTFEGFATCEIGGTFFGDQAMNPANPCEICDPSLDQNDWTPLDGNETCDDGDQCTSNGQCQMGVCVPQNTVQCNDGNPCTTDVCDSASGLCDFDASASDGDTCTLSGQPTCQTNVCSSGTCVPTAISGCLIDDVCYNQGDANPDNPCEICDPATDQTSWTDEAAGVTCQDGLFCTVNGQCDGSGTCVGQARDCSGAEDDCFANVTCSEVARACIPIMPVAAGTACGGDPCTTNGMCDGAGNCSGQQTDCTNLDTECMVGVCDVSDGSCSAVPRDDGTTCDDGDACTEDSTCQSGTCATGTAITCDDDNSCTVDSCDSTTGCVFDDTAAEGDACDDGSACTENDVCTSGACGGETIACDDGNTCTSQACDPAVGCTFDELVDGTPCVGDALGCTTDTCASGACDSTLDANFCVIDDACVAEGVENPDNTCEVCDPALSTDSYSPKTDGAACGLGQCNAENTGVVSGSCNAGTCTPGNAQDDIDCDPYVCADGACLDACVDDEDCQGDLVCDDSECTEPPEVCESDDDCEGDLVCVDDECVEPQAPTCTDDEDCDEGFECIDEECVEVDEPTDCTTDEDCDDGEFCNMFDECEADPTDPGPDTCTDDIDCGDGSRCVDAVCVSGTVEGGGCGCAASGSGPMEDASWLVVFGLGLIGWMRRRR